MDITIVSWASAYGHLNTTHYFDLYGHLPGNIHFIKSIPGV